MPTAIRLTVVDDHPLFVSGLELLLPDVTDGSVIVVGSTGDASAAAALVRRTVPDLVLVDVHMPPPGGIRAIAAIRRTTPQVRVIAMSGDEDPASAVAALRAGAEGFLPKTVDPKEVLAPLLVVLDGWAVLPTGVLVELLGATRAMRPAPADLDDAERQLLQLIAAGATTVEIGLQLRVSERTVKRLTAALLRKLRVSSRTEAAALAGRTGIL